MSATSPRLWADLDAALALYCAGPDADSRALVRDCLSVFSDPRGLVLRCPGCGRRFEATGDGLPLAHPTRYGAEGRN